MITGDKNSTWTNLCCFRITEHFMGLKGFLYKSQCLRGCFKYEDIKTHKMCNRCYQNYYLLKQTLSGDFRASIKPTSKLNDKITVFTN